MYTLVPLTIDALHIKFGFDWPSIFEYYGDIHVYCPGVVADQPLGPIVFRIINLQSICPFPSSFSLDKFPPIQMHRPPMLALP